MKHWKARLQDSDERLEAGDWKKGARIADFVLREMTDQIASGEGVARLLGAALLFRSIGEAGMKESRSASWDFYAAQSFEPAYSKVHP